MKDVFKKISFVTMMLITAFTVQTALAATIVVGGKGFTEQLLLAEITGQYLTAQGYDVELKTGMGTSLVRGALENKQVDMYWAYTGTAFLNFHKNKFANQPAEQIYEAVKAKDAQTGIVWLNASAANNTYALAVRQADAESKGLQSLEDLAAKLNAGDKLKLGCNIEFYKRDDGLKPLQKAYGFKFPRSAVKRMETGLVYKALKDGDVDVGLVFATDGRIPAFNFRVLKDTKNYFPAYAITPTVRKETLDANPDLAGQLNMLSGLIDDATMSALNAQVDVDKKSVTDVARGFLKANGLL
ncbi:glycine/betaine ABC transporter substrate-binding protein [Desulfosarcina alkanivorans]|uniref:Glycine/betaine ABC transporter substrate-binding protein n=1 Tax=Desulfosarcina alkanivorans TaxID=571177 RepID=A0A5K7YLV7_9BACT|nr:glycine betaine ABC transporter substrate-binding protein [Desulfosarcina alkanivorans]BBO69355.1 glycine/betaine ABC transporter substrate-binding protein [Desulfosarcina alkanivorans]